MRSDNENLGRTTTSDLKAVAQDMLRMGKHWTQAAQGWLDQRRESIDARDAGAGNAGRGYSGIGPRGYTRPDERIREELNERLTDAHDVDATDITVSVANGVATLGGSVDHRWMKHRAEDLADGCTGVRDVRNQIQVRTGTAGNPTNESNKETT